MINKINNTTNKANPPEKPQLPPQLPPNPIIVPPLIRGENKGTLMYFNGFKLLYVFYAIIEQVLLKIKKRHPKVPSSDWITTFHVLDCGNWWINCKFVTNYSLQHPPSTTSPNPNLLP